LVEHPQNSSFFPGGKNQRILSSSHVFAFGCKGAILLYIFFVLTSISLCMPASFASAFLTRYTCVTCHPLAIPSLPLLGGKGRIQPCKNPTFAKFHTENATTERITASPVYGAKTLRQNFKADLTNLPLGSQAAARLLTLHTFM